MNFKKFHVSKNLCNPIPYKAGYAISAEGVESANASFDIYSVTASASTEYSISVNIALSGNYVRVHAYNNGTWNEQIIAKTSQNLPFSFTTPANCDEIRISITHDALNHIMLNTGSTTQPYEPYSSEVWHDIPYYQHKTATDTITTLPAVVYANDTTATVGLKGQMEQSSTPTTSNPIQPSECGDLETVGEKAGQYKIPISSANATTPVYLGEVQTTRKVKKLVLTGEESWAVYSGFSAQNCYQFNTNITNHDVNSEAISTHFTYTDVLRTLIDNDGTFMFDSNKYIRVHISSCTTLEDFKSYLSAQYAAGTPVTVWYVLATPTTGITNEPLRKIGDYADEVSGITIPTIAGANTLSVDTTLQPSEVTATYKGWHPASAVHERENGAWT